VELRQVAQLNSWQRLVITLCRELRRRGYDLKGATDERVNRVACTHPATRTLLNGLGYEWTFPEEEQHRLAECVRFNLAFMESKTYAFGSIVDIQSDPCQHGKHIYCHECWSVARQQRR
jgi:hypothetical protein